MCNIFSVKDKGWSVWIATGPLESVWRTVECGCLIDFYGRRKSFSISQDMYTRGDAIVNFSVFFSYARDLCIDKKKRPTILLQNKLHVAIEVIEVICTSVIFQVTSIHNDSLPSQRLLLKLCLGRWWLSPQNLHNLHYSEQETLNFVSFHSYVWSKSYNWLRL